MCKTEKVRIQIGGHKVWIDSVFAQAAGGTVVPWDDRLCVFLRFDESADSILGFYVGFYVYLPVKRYERDEFLVHVRREGEKELEIHLRQGREARAKRAQEEEKQRDLDRIAAGVRTAIGLPESR